MKAIVEWGIAKHAGGSQPCGISGQCIMPNAKQAANLARQLAHTYLNGSIQPDFIVSAHNPRVVMWNAIGTHWIAVSQLDGVMRGPYAGIADVEGRDIQARAVK